MEVRDNRDVRDKSSTFSQHQLGEQGAVGLTFPLQMSATASLIGVRALGDSALAKKAKPATATREGGTGEISLRIVVEATQETPAYYVNHAEIAMSPHECAIWFARLPTKPSRQEMEDARTIGEIVVEPEFQVLIPPTLIFGLIKALETTRDNYEATFGPIRKVES